MVDDRSLAVLGGIDADRVAAAGWAFGSFTAGLTGVLLAPYVRLDPYGMPLLVMEVMAVAVAARMRSLPVAVVVALGLGVAQSQLTRLYLRRAGRSHCSRLWARTCSWWPCWSRRSSCRGSATGTPATHGDGPGGDAPGRVDRRGRAVPAAARPRGLGPAHVGAGARAGCGAPVPGCGDRPRRSDLPRAGGVRGSGRLFTALLAAGRFPGLPLGLPELAVLAVAVVLVAPLAS